MRASVATLTWTANGRRRPPPPRRLMEGDAPRQDRQREAGSCTAAGAEIGCTPTRRVTPFDGPPRSPDGDVATEIQVTGHARTIDGFDTTGPRPCTGQPGTTVDIRVEQGRTLTALLADDVHVKFWLIDLSFVDFTSQVGLSNNGTGSFTATSTLTVGDSPALVAAGDLDGDGDLDLAVTNQDSDNVTILTNSGTGTFTATSTLTVGDGPVSVAAGDLDGDGRLDLAVANFGSDNVSVLLNTTPLSNLAVAKSCTPTTGAARRPGDLHPDSHQHRAQPRHQRGRHRRTARRAAAEQRTTCED